MKRTYLDSSVLIAAFQSTNPERQARAWAVLSDPAREFASSVFVKLETLPTAKFHRNAAEIELYEGYFAGVCAWAVEDAQLIAAAFEIGEQCGAAGIDALHLAAAQATRADELVTAERPQKPMFRNSAVTVVSIWG